jgi:hypothetical protein
MVPVARPFLLRMPVKSSLPLHNAQWPFMPQTFNLNLLFPPLRGIFCAVISSVYQSFILASQLQAQVTIRQHLQRLQRPHQPMTYLHQRRQQEQQQNRQPVGVQKSKKTQVLHEESKVEVRQTPEISVKMQVLEEKAVQEHVVRDKQDRQDGMSDDPMVSIIACEACESKFESAQALQEHYAAFHNAARLEEQKGAPEIPNKENSVTPESQVIQKNVPFDREGFLRSEAAQRSVRKMILKAARVAKPGIELNWHRLTKRNPGLYKPDGFLLTIAEYRHHFLSKGSSRCSDFMTDLSSMMSEILDGVVL